LIYALDAQLDRIQEEGLENRFARHSAMAARTRAWAKERGFALYIGDNCCSQTVTSIDHGSKVNFNALNSFLIERGMRIANGYGEMKDKTFRIGHMGETQLTQLEELLAAMDEYLDQTG
jgi:aspartate aminotransferase-like enzyme